MTAPFIITIHGTDADFLRRLERFVDVEEYLFDNLYQDFKHTPCLYGEGADKGIYDCGDCDMAGEDCPYQEEQNEDTLRCDK